MERGVLDTSVVLDYERLSLESLPVLATIAAITLAELAAGPHAVTDLQERALRQARLQWAESEFTTLPFDAPAARAYARVYATVLTRGIREPRGARAVDLLIAATALSRGLPLYTRNAQDFTHLASLMPIISV